MTRKWVFDMSHATGFTEARIDFLNEWLPDLLKSLGLKTALDVGCGVGYFSRYLADLGLDVVALDGRPGNIEEAERRHPGIKFWTYNVEDTEMLQVGSFDLVVCFGLLYHLENPLQAIRNLHSMAIKVMLIESVCFPGRTPFLHLHDEGESEDQGLNFVGFYPSEGCLVKMCYRAGFPYVYFLRNLPVHEDFRKTFWRERIRTMVVASKLPLDFPFMKLVGEPKGNSDLWSTPWGKFIRPGNRLWSFLKKPWSDKLTTLQRHLKGHARTFDKNGP
jgi:SAM-dependent methyltransferase